jgi:hypothetical protein
MLTAQEGLWSMMLFAQSAVLPYASYFKSSNTESENEIFNGYLINITNAQVYVTSWFRLSCSGRVCSQKRTVQGVYGPACWLLHARQAVLRSLRRNTNKHENMCS